MSSTTILVVDAEVLVCFAIADYLRDCGYRVIEAVVLEPPSDWKRDGVVSCSCQFCQELNAFLADPGRRAWTFKAAEAKRRHLESTIRQDRSDLDLATERRGSPHALICTKNQARYERRARQRKADLENFDRLKSRKPERAR